MFNQMNCPLCSSAECREVGQDKRRVFVRCSECTLIFIPHAYHLSRDAEKLRYDLHDNTSTNKGYVRFLTEVADVAETLLPPNAKILDLGCGKEAVLTKILLQRGRLCVPFDPLYNFPPPLSHQRYDMVIMCEVIEHCRDLRYTLNEIDKLLVEDGVALIRTKCYPAVDKLTTWWYAQDMTHVNFFSRKALVRAAECIGRTLEDTARRDVFLMR